MFEPIEVNKTTLNKFCQIIEELINDLVEESKILNWKEDHITLRFLSQLNQRLSGSLITDLDNGAIFLTPYKVSPEVEKKFGDIAIIVHIEYGDGDEIEGIAFLEAKKKDVKKRKYMAIKWEQLERIFESAPHSQLLLYDFRDISEFAPTGLVSKKSATSGSPMTQLPVTKFVTIPVNKVMEIKKKNERLYKLSLPFSYQLAYRYMNGFDLDYDHNTIKSIKDDFAGNYQSLELPVPEYLLHINIIPDKKLKEDKRNGDKKTRMVKIPPTGINPNIYNIIKPNK